MVRTASFKCKAQGLSGEDAARFCYIKTNLEREYTIPKPSTFVKLRITPAKWKGYLPAVPAA
jgi:hypothetical protein